MLTNRTVQRTVQTAVRPAPPPPRQEASAKFTKSSRFSLPPPEFCVCPTMEGFVHACRRAPAAGECGWVELHKGGAGVVNSTCVAMRGAEHQQRMKIRRGDLVGSAGRCKWRDRHAQSASWRWSRRDVMARFGLSHTRSRARLGGEVARLPSERLGGLQASGGDVQADSLERGRQGGVASAACGVKAGSGLAAPGAGQAGRLGGGEDLLDLQRRKLTCEEACREGITYCRRVLHAPQQGKLRTWASVIGVALLSW